MCFLPIFLILSLRYLEGLFTCSVGLNLIIIVDQLEHSSYLRRPLLGHLNIDSRDNILGKVSRVLVIQGKNDMGTSSQVKANIVWKLKLWSILGPHIDGNLFSHARWAPEVLLREWITLRSTNPSFFCSNTYNGRTNYCWNVFFITRAFLGLFFIFASFRFSLKITEDGMQIADLRCWKPPLCQLCRNQVAFLYFVTLESNFNSFVIQWRKWSKLFA